MNNKITILIILYCILTSCTSEQITNVIPEGERPPNILCIFVDDLGFGDEEENPYGEAVDAEYRGTPNVNQKKSELDNPAGKGNNKASGTVRKSGGKASSAFTNKVGPDGERGHPLVNQKKSELDNPLGTSNNKANGTVRGKGQDAFRS